MYVAPKLFLQVSTLYILQLTLTLPYFALYCLTWFSSLWNTWVPVSLNRRKNNEVKIKKEKETSIMTWKYFLDISVRQNLRPRNYKNSLGQNRSSSLPDCCSVLVHKGIYFEDLNWSSNSTIGEIRYSLKPHTRLSYWWDNFRNISHCSC